MTTVREQFMNWANENGYDATRFTEETGMPYSAVDNLFHDRNNMDLCPRRMTPSYRIKIHKLTGLDVFAFTPQTIVGETVNIDQLEDWQKTFLGYMADNGLNQSRMAKLAGISPSCVSKYTREPTPLENISKKNREALYRVTGLQCLDIGNAGYGVHSSFDQQLSSQPYQPDPRIDTIIEKVEGLQTLIQSQSTTPLPIPSQDDGTALYQSTDDALVRRTTSLFDAFVETLEQYKSRPRALDHLKQSLPAKDAGYLVGLVNALYAKDPLSKWVLNQPKPVRNRP